MKGILSLLLIVFFVFTSCATLPVQESLNITVREVEDSEVLFSYLISPVHLMVFSKSGDLYIASVVWTVGSAVVRYAYLERGKLVGFCFDIDHFELTGESTYISDTFTYDQIKYLTEMLNNFSLGLDPMIDEEQWEEPEQKLKEV